MSHTFRLEFFSLGRVCLRLVWSVFFCVALQQTALGANEPNPSNSHTVAVLSVSSEAIKSYDNPEKCSQTLLTTQQFAQKEESEKTWAEKNWVASLAGGTGFLVGVPLAAQVASIASGALTVPTILLTGGIAFFITQMLVPANPMLSPPKPGSYIASQKFYLEPLCEPEPVKYKALSHYRVTYRFNGKIQSALLKYDPGARLTLTAQGRPVNEIAPIATAKP